MFGELAKAVGVAERDTVRIGGLPMQGAAHLLAESFDPDAQPFLRFIVAAGNDRMETLAEDISFFLNLRLPGALLSIQTYPSDDFTPFAGVAPDRADASRRLGVLHRLARGERIDFLIASAPALLKKVMPGKILNSAGDYLIRGVEIDRRALLANLGRGGYLRTPIVDGPGQFSVRGGIIDVWSPLYDHPVRSEFMGDTAERLRFFDPESQRTFRDTEELYAPPVSELVLQEGAKGRAAAAARDICERAALPPRTLFKLLEDLEGAVPWSYPVFLLPAFYDEMTTLGGYVEKRGPEVRLFVAERESVSAAVRSFLDEAAETREAALASGTPCLPLESYYESAGAVEALQNAPGAVSWSLGPGDPGETSLDASETYRGLGGLAGEMEALRSVKGGDSLGPLTGRIAEWSRSGLEVAAAFPSREQADRLSFLLGERGIPVTRAAGTGRGVRIVEHELSAGLTAPGLACFTEEEVFGAKVRHPRPRATLKGAAATLMDLKEGEHVVHKEYGVGIYRGLKKLALWGAENDFFTIEYRDKARVYLPVQRLGLVRKYRVPEGGVPRLDRLGSGSWENTKAAVKDELLGLAGELLKLQALRKLQGGTAFTPPGDYFTEFCASFEHEETPDQARAVDDVMADMQKSEPMDRLIVGDVGFGKTEVAIRAAFKAVEDGRQAAVLVPTTVLAQQHYRTFSARLDRYPVKVGLLSRFAPPAEIRKTLSGLKGGSVDIVIGTHRALQKDVRFKNLGLLVIDEEHRFGVAHKERIKRMAAGVDILTLTATPIPRTLHMAFEGLKDFSIIQSPPPDRHAVKTQVLKFDEAAIRDALEHELRRGGQAFFVHDRVQSMGGIREMLERLLPGAKTAVAHGQMDAAELEKAMVDFVDHKIDVLLCTTIIGAGLDIPSANTIIIDRAEQLGLGQLYQLRGRVGRGRERAYAYLLLPKTGKLQPDARERLEIMSEFQHLGAGFNVAMRDLEMRGAGNLLGKKQHGHMARVGFELYMELLEQAMSELNCRPAGKAVDPEVKLPVPAFIPESYMGDVPLRLDYYQRMSLAATAQEAAAILEEIEDRFGRCPREVSNLADIMGLTADLRAIGAESLEYGRGSVVLRFAAGAQIDAGRLVSWIQKNRTDTKFTPDGRLIYSLGDTGPDDLIGVVHAWVLSLGLARTPTP